MVTAAAWTPGQSIWTLDLFVLTNLALVIALYFWGVHRVRAKGLGWAPGRTLALLAGVGLLGVAYLGPFETLAHAYFWAHMGQHLTVMMLAAPLLVLSAPVSLVVLATSGPTRASIIRALRSRVGLFLVNPVFTWLLFAITLVGTHVTPVMEWVLGDHDAMAFVERPLYLVAALLFYYPLIGNDMCARRPRPSMRVLSLGLMMIPETMLGAIIFFSPILLYPSYVASAAVLGYDPAFDQRMAGALMWALTMVIDSFWMMLAAIEWFRSEERRTRRMEAAERLSTS